MSIRVRPVRRLGSAAAALAALATVVLCASPAHAAAGGYVRLAHLSPDTPAVDVYLKSDTGAAKDQRFNGVAYGAMSDYLRLPTGTYSVGMRRSGAAASTPPVLTTQVTVGNGAAYTVAGVGRYADLGLRVLKDDLRLPDAGASTLPRDGVATGEGGSRPRSPLPRALLLAGLAGLLTGGVLVGLRRRSWTA